MPSQHAKNIALTEKWYQWVDELVKTGEYRSASEVVRDGLRALQTRKEREQFELEALKHKVKSAIKQADNDEFAKGTGKQVINRVFQDILENTSK